jgi:hypothetical protein
MLWPLETELLGADGVMLILCTNLMRADFSAAGTLLNWVSARKAKTRAVHFFDVSHWAAVFFMRSSALNTPELLFAETDFYPSSKFCLAA